MQFKKWLILTESKEEKALALELAGDEAVINQLQSVIKPKDTNIVDKLLLLASYYYNQTKNLNQIKRDIQDYIDLLNNKKMNLITVDPATKKPDTDYLNWTRIIHGHHGEEEAKQRRDFTPTDAGNEQSIASSRDGKIKVYEAHGRDKCIILGKGQSFCISKPGNTMWQSYRDNQESTYYFVKDSSRNDRLSTVVVDMNVNGPELTDVSNKTGTTLDPFTGELTEDTEPYFKYLQDNGVDTSVFKNIPHTSEEESEMRRLGKPNKSLEWFKNLDHEYKSKYIGRGHELSNEQFDYLFDNNFYSLLEQYVKIGQRLDDHQIDKIAGNSDLRKNYIHNRIMQQEHENDLDKKEWDLFNEKQKQLWYSKAPKTQIMKKLVDFNELEEIKKFNYKPYDGGSNIVAHALDDEKLDILKYLVDNNYYVPSDAITDAITRRQLAVAKYLLETGHPYNIGAVISAINSGDLNFLKYFMKYIIDVSPIMFNYEIQKSDALISSAALRGYLDIVKYLIEEVKLNIDPKVLPAAARSGNLELVKYLVNKNTPIRSDAINNSSTPEIKEYLTKAMEEQ